MLAREQLLHARSLHLTTRGSFTFAVEPVAPNWAAVNEDGAFLLEQLSSPQSISGLVTAYQARSGGSFQSAERDVSRFLDQLFEADLVSFEPSRTEQYAGRGAQLSNDRLEEFWVQINDFCNLSCDHCFVSSSPESGKGLPAETVRDAVQQALDLGVKLIGITGGEPFFREDIFDLWELILSDPSRSVMTLTNGTLLKGKVLERIKQMDTSRIELRVSLDGATAEVNDPIRGKGSFKQAIRGIRNAVEAGCRVTVTTSLNGRNADRIHEMPELLAELGVKRMHVLWPFQRGRALKVVNQDLIPTVGTLTEGYRRIREAADAAGVMFYTYASWKMRIDGAPGFKYDLSNHCWSSLCMDTDGSIYPSPALTQHSELRLGSVLDQSLEQVWRNSEVAERFRKTSVVDRPQCRDCSVRFICGGGDTDHTYNTSRSMLKNRGDLLADDPYCSLYEEMIADSMKEWTEQALGFRDEEPEGPAILRRMGHRPDRLPKQLGQGRLPLGTVPST